MVVSHIIDSQIESYWRQLFRCHQRHVFLSERSFWMGSASIMGDDDNDKPGDVIIIPWEYLHWKPHNPFNIMALKTISRARSTLELRYEIKIAAICRTFQKLLWRKYKVKRGTFFPFYYEACNTIVMYIFTQLILVYNVTMSNATIKLKFNTIFMGNKWMQCVLC